MAEKENRCWPGYEPVPGKKQHSEGSCRPKADSKSTPAQKKFKAERRTQLDQWKAEHPGVKASAAQHLHAPGEKTASLKKKTAPKKAAVKKKTVTKKKSTATRKQATEKTSSSAPKTAAK